MYGICYGPKENNLIPLKGNFQYNVCYKLAIYIFPVWNIYIGTMDLTNFALFLTVRHCCAHAQNSFRPKIANIIICR